jgi:hypothetical protein
VQFLGGVAYQPNGNELAAGFLHGLKLIRDAGGVIRSLPVPGVNFGCNAVRWWDARTILASCMASATTMSRLWLVPASGKTPRALTPVSSRPGLAGYFTAWQLSNGLYVNAHYGCGGSIIERQPSRGPERPVIVPGATYSLIVTATSSGLMVDRFTTNCGPAPTSSLVWFNPATRALKVAIPDLHSQWGVIATVPYFVTGKY